MTLQEHISYWLNGASHDLEAAESMFETGKYDWSLFIPHLVLEKTLKAKFVSDSGDTVPPKVHNLVRIAERTKLVLTEEQRLLLDEVSDFNMDARYPDYRNSFSARCSKDFAAGYFRRTKEIAVWIRSQIR